MCLRVFAALLFAIHLGSAVGFRLKRHKQNGNTAVSIAGVPVYNHDLAYNAPSSGLLQVDLMEDRSFEASWIVMLKSSVSQAQLEALCNDAPANTECTPEGHEGAIPFVEMRGTTADLEQLLEAHSSVVDFVEPDLPVHMIPEVPSAQNIQSRYLPIYVNGNEWFTKLSNDTHQVLIKQGASSWLVSDKDLEANFTGYVPSSLAWRAKKDLSAFTGDMATWGTVVNHGVDEGDGWVRFEAPENKPWGLERIGADKAATTGRGVHIYVLDTGVRTTHQDFGGRAIPTLEFLDTVTGPRECQRSDTTSCAYDAQGHGTHCAGTAGGSTYGVAPGSTIHAVKVLNDMGGGNNSGVLGALDWVMVKGDRPAVVSMSLGWEGKSIAFKAAIDKATESGVTVVVAAGNENKPACEVSPAYVPSAITVASMSQGDKRSDFSNTGRCVQIYAPGENIRSAAPLSDYASQTMSGTSMACPQVAGAAALLLETTPTMSSDQVLQTLLDNSQADALTNTTPSCPNKLLYVGADGAPATPAPTAAPSDPAPQCAGAFLCGIAVGMSGTCKGNHEACGMCAYCYL